MPRAVFFVTGTKSSARLYFPPALLLRLFHTSCVGRAGKSMSEASPPHLIPAQNRVCIDVRACICSSGPRVRFSELRLLFRRLRLAAGLILRHPHGGIRHSTRRVVRAAAAEHCCMNDHYINNLLHRLKTSSISRRLP